MFIPVLVFGIVSSVTAGYAGSGAASGNYVSSNGQQYGYGGASNYGSGGAGPVFFPPNPAFPYVPPFDFNTLFDGLRQQQQAFQNFQQQFHQAANQYASGYGYNGAQGFAGGASFPNRGSSGFQGAGAFASIGPKGVHQAAHLLPENPASPNINTRFGPEATGGAPGPKTYGVFTTSTFGSSNINGKETSWKQASTTVNDNGKVTTYTLRDP